MMLQYVNLDMKMMSNSSEINLGRMFAQGCGFSK